MLRPAFIIAAILVLAPFAASQQSGGSTQPGAQGSKTMPSETTPKSGSTQQNARATASAEFSAAVVESLLDRVNSGFAAHSAPSVLSAFDHTRMRDYSRFAARLQSTFAQYESFRLHFHVAQWTASGDAGTAVVEIEYEATPVSDVSAPVLKGNELRFTFARTPQGWKITSIKPWNFFS